MNTFLLLFFLTTDNYFKIPTPDFVILSPFSIFNIFSVSGFHSSVSVLLFFNLN